MAAAIIIADEWQFLVIVDNLPSLGSKTIFVIIYCIKYKTFLTQRGQRWDTRTGAQNTYTTNNSPL